MWLFALIPFALQALVILFDEAYFHYKRGLPKWEKIGHPMDTLSLILCLIWMLWMPFDELNLKIYVALAIFSCLMVTKDEFIHKSHCPGAENWLHALLFILHPINLIVAGFIWPVIDGVEVPRWIAFWLDTPEALRLFLYTQLGLMALFCAYQLIFWNIVWRNRPVIKY